MLKAAEDLLFFADKAAAAAIYASTGEDDLAATL
jgi:hypothetical protein